MFSLTIFALVLQGAWKILAISADGINVALHAQVPPSEDMVVGSAITMAGVKQALLERRGYSGRVNGGKDVHHLSHLKIAHAEIFFPFTYGGLHDKRWDLVIIEGWFKMINAFIHEVFLTGSEESTPRVFWVLITYSSVSCFGGQWDWLALMMVAHDGRTFRYQRFVAILCPDTCLRVRVTRS